MPCSRQKPYPLNQTLVSVHSIVNASCLMSVVVVTSRRTKYQGLKKEHQGLCNPKKSPFNKVHTRLSLPRFQVSHHRPKSRGLGRETAQVKFHSCASLPIKKRSHFCTLQIPRFGRGKLTTNIHISRPVAKRVTVCVHARSAGLQQMSCFSFSFSSFDNSG